MANLLESMVPTFVRQINLYYFNIEYQISSPTGYSNFTIVDGINLGIGYVW